MSDELPATGPTDEGATTPPSANGDLALRSTAVLRALGAPDHADGFWDDLDRTFADEPQLRLTPRSAIRPITQPPLVTDDRTVVGDVAIRRANGGRRRRGRLLVWVVALVLTALVIAGALQRADSDTETGAGASGDPAEDVTRPAGEDPPVTGSNGPPETTDSPAAVPSDAELEPSGIGPLRVGASLRDLEADDLGISVDQLTFDGSGGTCFDAAVHGSPDLVLRFRSPDPDVGVDDPLNAVLVAMGIDGQAPTDRAVAGTGVALGTPAEEVRSAYAGNLIDAPHPYVPGGHVYLVSVGDGTGVAFGTDARVVTSIAVGVQDVVQHIDGCG